MLTTHINYQLRGNGKSHKGDFEEFQSCWVILQKNWDNLRNSWLFVEFEMLLILAFRKQM